MAEENELEKRAVEELLRETSRARIRAETMGPAGWLKCPLRSTNKRFLLNTLRSTSLQRRSAEPRPGHSATGGRLRSESPDRRRDRSRTPPRRDHGSKRDHTTDRKHRHRHSHKSKDKKPDRDKDRRHRHKEDRDRRHTDGQNKDRDRRTATE